MSGFLSILSHHSPWNQEMKCQWRMLAALALFFMFPKTHYLTTAAKSDDKYKATNPEDNCNGIFVSYSFLYRTKEYPYLKNATAQSWAFNATATILNTGTIELDDWEIYIGFQHREILISASGAVLMDGGDFPADVSNGTYLSGYPQTDLKTSIDTAGDLSQIQAQILLSGTQFGIRPPGIPMPKTIQLVNDGFKCPSPTKHKTSMYTCCVRDKKHKHNVTKTKFLPRRKGDLLISYDVIQAYESSYLALVTIENSSPLGRLDHWNLTWEWMRGEFISTMKGAYTHLVDYSDCIYGAAGTYYKSLDFSKIMNCQKKPIITDLPRERANDTQIGRIPYCCRNGSLLPTLMDPSQSKAAFQVEVYKIPPDIKRTAIYPPEKWKIIGILNPEYKCGAPIKVAPTEFPDSSGLQAVTLAISSWQIVCNITRPTSRNSRCCVTFSAYYNDSVVPCNTCACGCDDTTKCNEHAPAMLLPSDTLLVPFENRSHKAIAWAKLKHFHIPNPLPCGDNCGVSINWHILSNYQGGWTARITLFNWEEINFEDWSVVIQLKKASKGYRKAYSMNGTFLPQVNNTIFLQGIKGLNYLMGKTNGSELGDPKVPGKVQSVISFTKKHIPGISMVNGDGFPSRVYFNGEECSIPWTIPKGNGYRNQVNLLLVIVVGLITLVLIENSTPKML